MTVFYKPLTISVEGNKHVILHCGRNPLSWPTLRLSTVVCFPPEFVSTCLINHAIQRCQHCTDITACVGILEIRCQTKHCFKTQELTNDKKRNISGGQICLGKSWKTQKIKLGANALERYPVRIQIRNRLSWLKEISIFLSSCGQIHYKVIDVSVKREQMSKTCTLKPINPQASTRNTLGSSFSLLEREISLPYTEPRSKSTVHRLVICAAIWCHDMLSTPLTVVIQLKVCGCLN